VKLENLWLIIDGKKIKLHGQILFDVCECQTINLWCLKLWMKLKEDNGGIKNTFSYFSHFH
jgi:hypothetical protein